MASAALSHWRCSFLPPAAAEKEGEGMRSDPNTNCVCVLVFRLFLRLLPVVSVYLFAVIIAQWKNEEVGNE